MGQVLERGEGWDLLIQLVYLLVVVAQPCGGKAAPVSTGPAVHHPIHGHPYTPEIPPRLPRAAANGTTVPKSCRDSVPPARLSTGTFLPSQGLTRACPGLPELLVDELHLLQAALDPLDAGRETGKEE